MKAIYEATIKVIPSRVAEKVVQQLGRNSINLPEIAAGIGYKVLEGEQREVFCVIFLDQQNQPLGFQKVTTGIADASLVHPREVFRAAILTGASSILLLHNHPSGKLKPSQEDISITRRLIRSGELLDIRILDHIIIGDAVAPDVSRFHAMRSHDVEGLWA